MLDQNTDRMWYVIGAVIVGAAIIFLVNSSFPQLFASVGDTFKEKTEESMKVVDNTGPVTVKGLDGVVFQQGVLFGSNDDPKLIDAVKPKTDRKHWYTSTYVPTNGAKSITIQLKDTLPDFKQSRGRVNGYGSDKVFTRSFIDDLDKSTPYTTTYAIPDNVSYMRIMLVYADKGEYVITLNNK